MIAPLAASLSSAAQTDFKATPTAIAMAESGRQDIMLVETDHERFSMVSPAGYGSRVLPDTRSVIFTSSGGDSVITVRFTTKYAGGLPTPNKLRDDVAANFRGASLVASSASSTAFGPAQSFELFRPAANGLMLRIRDVYAAYREGSVELTFSCSSADFDKQKFGFAHLLNSFRLLSKNGTTNP
jgi:hypothetical protein